MLKIYCSCNFTNTLKESHFLIWEKLKIWVSYFLGCPFYWQAHSGRFNYAWLNEVSIWSNLKLFEKTVFSVAEKANIVIVSAMYHGLYISFMAAQDFWISLPRNWPLKGGGGHFFISYFDSFSIEVTPSIWGGSLLEWLEFFLANRMLVSTQNSGELDLLMKCLNMPSYFRAWQHQPLAGM